MHRLSIVLAFDLSRNGKSDAPDWLPSLYDRAARKNFYCLVRSRWDRVT